MLEDAGFVTYESLGDDNATVSQFPRATRRSLLVVGDDGDVPDEDVVLPAATAFNADGIPLVVADVLRLGRRPAGAGLGAGAHPRRRPRDEGLDRRRPRPGAGPATAELALADLRQVPPVVGHYGLAPRQADARRRPVKPASLSPLPPSSCRRGRRSLAAAAVAGSDDSVGSRRVDPAAPRSSTCSIISLPNVEWADIVDARLPNLQRLFADSAIGALITNGVVRPSPLGNSYVTLGAGTRAVANGRPRGRASASTRSSDATPPGRCSRRAPAHAPGQGIVYMPIADVTEQNDGELYGAEVGLLGDELARAGVARAVIANGDGSDPSTPEDRFPPFRRSGGGRAHDERGPGARWAGRPRHPPRDATAPFGVRLDHDVVTDAFRDAWDGERAVVLVEGSDLVRADLAGRFASDTQRERMRARALRSTDRLVGRLLAEVDPARDAVIVVGPVSPNEPDALTTAAVARAGLRARPAAVDDDGPRRVREHRRRRAHDPRPARPRPPRRRWRAGA